ncbi:MAG: hypothetical protein JOZ22_19285, partial [Acidobacteriia bacterium]|nr:hypothetical protein [Terriglobia bacterium]
RMLSHYSFLQRTEPELIQRKGRMLALEELLASKPHIHFDNALVRHFGGVDERAFPPGTIGQEQFDAAVYFLRTGFTFVGHQEFAAEAYACMRERFGWNARPRLEIVNAAETRIEDARLPAICQAMAQYNPWDCKLYEEILRLFPYRRNG